MSKSSEILIKNRIGNSKFHQVVIAKDLSQVQDILEDMSKSEIVELFSARGENGNTILHLVFSNYDNVEIRTLLLDQLVSLGETELNTIFNITDRAGKSAIYKLIHGDNAETNLVRLLTECQKHPSLLKVLLTLQDDSGQHFFHFIADNSNLQGLGKIALKQISDKSLISEIELAQDIYKNTVVDLSPQMGLELKLRPAEIETESLLAVRTVKVNAKLQDDAVVAQKEIYEVENNWLSARASYLDVSRVPVVVPPVPASLVLPVMPGKVGTVVNKFTIAQADALRQILTPAFNANAAAEVNALLAADPTFRPASLAQSLAPGNDALRLADRNAAIQKRVADYNKAKTDHDQAHAAHDNAVTENKHKALVPILGVTYIAKSLANEYSGDVKAAWDASVPTNMNSTNVQTALDSAAAQIGVAKNIITPSNIVNVLASATQVIATKNPYFIVDAAVQMGGAEKLSSHYKWNEYAAPALSTLASTGYIILTGHPYVAGALALIQLLNMGVSYMAKGQPLDSNWKYAENYVHPATSAVMSGAKIVTSWKFGWFGKLMLALEMAHDSKLVYDGIYKQAEEIRADYNKDITKQFTDYAPAFKYMHLNMKQLVNEELAIAVADHVRGDIKHLDQYATSFAGQLGVSGGQYLKYGAFSNPTYKYFNVTKTPEQIAYKAFETDGARYNLVGNNFGQVIEYADKIQEAGFYIFEEAIFSEAAMTCLKPSLSLKSITNQQIVEVLTTCSAKIDPDFMNLPYNQALLSAYNNTDMDLSICSGAKNEIGQFAECAKVIGSDFFLESHA